MAEVMRRFGWLVFVAACHNSAATVDACHHDCCGPALIVSNWTEAKARGCKDGYQGYACKDGTGWAMYAFGTGNVWEFFDGKGVLVGENFETDVSPSQCPTEYWGTQLACDMTPIDLACQNTPP